MNELGTADLPYIILQKMVVLPAKPKPIRSIRASFRVPYTVFQILEKNPPISSVQAVNYVGNFVSLNRCNINIPLYHHTHELILVKITRTVLKLSCVLFIYLVCLIRIRLAACKHLALKMF